MMPPAMSHPPLAPKEEFPVTMSSLTLEEASTLEPHPKLEGRELCYVCLEDCDVWFLDDDSTETEKSGSKKSSPWLDVVVPQSHHGRLLSENLKETREGACPHCYLILKKNPNQVSHGGENHDFPTHSLFSQGPRFDGTIHDTKPHVSRCRCTSKRPRQRSDAALMVGLALASHDLGQFKIRSIKVAPHNTLPTGDSMKKAKVTILITFTCLEIARKPTVKGPSEQIGVRRFITNSSKPFPASSQLLMCLVRSDWEYYDITIAKMDGEGSELKTTSDWRNSAVSFFPPKMTLENTYERIHGVSVLSDWYLDTTEQPHPGKRSSEVANITMPPEDVLCKVASYLRAPSLHALRCTCKRLYRALRGVVPGLNLKLYRHQVKSLLWMRSRETKLLFESDLGNIEHQANIQRRINCREADAHRAATGGASLILSPRDAKKGVRISQANGDEMEVPEESIMSRPLARGGLLCDDPGLGKTITVLSLILQTLGLSTEKEITKGDQAASKEDEDVDDKIFKAHWKENMVQEVRRQEMTQLFNAFLRCSADIVCFLEVSDRVHDGAIFRNIVCLKDIKARIVEDEYDEFEKFDSDVKLCFLHVLSEASEDSMTHQAASRLLGIFKGMVEAFKRKKVGVARKSFSRSARRPDSEVAAFVEKTNLERLNDALLPSCGTLLVVPAVLLDHWVEQMKTHVNTAFCTDKIPIICEYRGNHDSTPKMDEVIRQCTIEKTHFPFLFIDRTSHSKLPSPCFLAMFRVVLTTNQRFSNEWRKGSFENELKKKDAYAAKETLNNMMAPFSDFDRSGEEASPLLKVNWLRMIVDEGHSMGKGKDGSHISFASWVNAERRWAMTGTPTKQTSSQTGLSNILNLMKYLNHDFFSRRQSGDVVWNQLIMRGWNRGFLSSFFRMKSLFTLLMVRHTKNDIEELPPPTYKTTILPMSQEEVSTYNTLCCAIQTNLLVTSMNGKTSGLQDSLLHKSQTKHAIEAVSNLRLVCVGGTQVRPTLSQKNKDDFLLMFDAGNQDKEKRQEVRQFISRATAGSLSPCSCCEMMLSSLLVFPCGHLVCTECVDSATTSCIVCDNEFDIDTFQKLQPGFVFEWLHNIEEETRIRNQGAMPAAPAPPINNAVGGAGIAPVNNVVDDNDAVEDNAAGNAPANHPGGGNAADIVGHGPINHAADARNGPVNIPGGNAFVRINLANNVNMAPFQGRERLNRPNDGHLCIYGPNHPGVCELCHKQHDGCDLIDEGSQCEICHLRAEDCPTKETKPHYVVNKILSLYKEQQEAKSYSAKYEVPAEFMVEERRPLKVIVFSQFRKTLNQTGDRLLRRFGGACIAEYWGRYRKKELQKFVHDEKCVCMLLGKDGSEGLDLSFVTHIIFLEQVWDKSLENQAVSRAWRMGAKGSVEVETLIAQDSIEEIMSKLEKQLENDFDADTDDVEGVRSVADGVKTAEYRRAKTHYLLKHLNLIINSNTLGFASGEKRKASELNSDFQGTQEASSRKKIRSATVNVRFQEQQEIYEYDIN